MLNKEFHYSHKTAFDILYFCGFVGLIIVVAFVINTFIFRSFVVVGNSMQHTLQPDNHLVVNKLPVTFAHIVGKEWQPARGEIIVFKNPTYNLSGSDEYIVKRVIGLPGERVTVKDGTLTVYNLQNPRGFQPDRAITGPLSPTSGTIETLVPSDEIFVCGDNRIGNNSLDSRDGLGTIKLSEIEGQVALRIYPLNELRSF